MASFHTDLIIFVNIMLELSLAQTNISYWNYLFFLFFVLCRKDSLAASYFVKNKLNKCDVGFIVTVVLLLLLKKCITLFYAQ